MKRKKRYSDCSYTHITDFQHRFLFFSESFVILVTNYENYIIIQFVEKTKILFQKEFKKWLKTVTAQT